MLAEVIAIYDTVINILQVENRSTKGNTVKIKKESILNAISSFNLDNNYCFPVIINRISTQPIKLNL